MRVYRITKARYAGQLTASGGAARWNSRGQYVIYTAATRALACLENVVHLSGEGLEADFKVMLIDIPDALFVEKIAIDQLPDEWFTFQNYNTCQQIGDDWLQKNRSAVLQVPSAIIPGEWNYLLNPLHPEFGRIQLIGSEPFVFDPRIKK
ncbi:RES family NAD+ phosphorylase [Larkinella sp. VNQ87]|uniref:RES family NAD+ phosphorylase n=1 Tax=Larkinella sp. VNQ87 TaxID=3400921 RepID=UPI003C0E5AD8